MASAHLSVDLLVVGGGLGGVAAALTACRLGQRVILSESNRWLGGQLTAQAVPPDEHQWVETDLVSPSYARLRTKIRDHYRDYFPLTTAAMRDPHLNPGRGYVSRLSHEPRVGALVLEQLLSAELSSGQLTLLREHRPFAATRSGRQVTSVTLQSVATGATTAVRADLIADATELGDLLELADMEHVYGAESSQETGELHAPSAANPQDQQAVTWCCALEWAPGQDNVIDRPARYDFFASEVADFWPGPQLSFDDIDPITLEKRTRPLFASDPALAAANDERDLWHYRRARTLRNLQPGQPGGEITLVNWPQIDYWEKPLLGVTPAKKAAAEEGARALTRSFIYWLQTEAPRWDTGFGYPELRLRGDATGTEDGLAMDIYVRESRRIRALFTITEGHIGREMRGEGTGSAVFEDAVGIGYYRIDLHPSTAGRSYLDIDCYPFQIPLGALIPRDVDNVLAANKNIGTTHITNGAYRLHPVEWSIGEAVGALSAFCAEQATTPRHVHGDRDTRRRYQQVLIQELGITLQWPDDIRCSEATYDAPVKEAGPHATPRN